MKYLWNSTKKNRMQHVSDKDGTTLCKMENGVWNLDTSSSTPDPNRKVCGICSYLLEVRNEPPKLPKRKAGKTDRRDPFLHCWEWKTVRYQALVASDGRCGCCGRGQKDGVILNVDHIIPRKKRPDLALTPSNLQVLCNECNHGKGNRDQTDWRPA